MRGRHSRFAPLGVFLLCLSLTACFGGKGGGGGNGGGGNGGGGGQQVAAIGIQGVSPSSFVAGGTGTFMVQVANMGGKDSASATTLTADLGNIFTIGAGSGGGNPGSPSWNCGASVGAQVNCTFAAPIAAHSTAPSLTINVNVNNVGGPGFITFNVANPDGIAGGGASFTVNFTVSGSGGAGGVGGTVTITTPEPLISFPELVVAGTANARTTAILQAIVVSGDNGAGIDWYVCVGSATTGACSGASVLGGNSTLGTISSSGHSASGAFVTYMAPASLPGAPDGNFVIITAQQPGTMGAAAGPPSTTTVVPYIVQTNNQIPTGDQTEGANFVFRLRGFTSSGGLAYGIIGRFHVDGAGGVTKGVEDINIAQADGTSVVYTEVPFTGTYDMVNSSNGTMNLTVMSPPWTIAPIPPNPPPTTMTFAFTLDDQAATGKIIEAEPTGTYVGSGLLKYQYPLTVFNSTSVSGSYAFSLETPTGTGSSGVHHGVIGRLDLVTGLSSTIGTVANTSTVDDDSGNPTQNLTGTYVLDGPTADHGTLTLTSSSNTSHSTFYVVDKRHIFALGSDPNTVANNRGVLLGSAIRIAANASGQQDTFNNASLTGPFVFTALGETPSIAARGQGHASAMIGRFSGTAGAAGAGTFAGIFDINDGGTVPAGPLSIVGASGSGPGNFTIGTDGRGRGVLNISSNASGPLVTYHFVFYFVSPGLGFLQEQPASDLSRRGRSGEFLFQAVTAPIAFPPINLTFEGGTTADTAASLHRVAVFQLNGATTPVSLTETADTSQSGMSSQIPASTGTGTVAITDQTNGRGTVTATSGTIAGSSGAVIYLEDPSEFLLMGTDATLQEPQIITMDQ